MPEDIPALEARWASLGFKKMRCWEFVLWIDLRRPNWTSARKMSLLRFMLHRYDMP